MFDAAQLQSTMTQGDQQANLLLGAIHFLNRVVPLIFEDKEFFMKSMWHEQPSFGNQVNAILILEAVSILLFKPGFTIKPMPEPTQQVHYFGKCLQH
jgi:hypothetical protein